MPNVQGPRDHFLVVGPRSQCLRVLVATLVPALLAAGCGLEGLFFVRKFSATPPAHAVVKGRVGGLPAGLDGRVGGATLRARALAADGRELGAADARRGEEFRIDLPVGVGDQFNVRVVVSGGSVSLRALAPEVRDGSGSSNAETDVGEVGGASTAAVVLVEQYAGSARSGLAGTPPAVAGKVMENARDTARAEVAAFHAVASSLMDAMDPARGAPGFSDSLASPSDALLAAAGVTREAYDTALAAALAVVGVPVVCDPSRIRVVISTDISGLALDGNGKKQFIRQLPREGRVFLGITLDPSSPVADAARTLKPRLVPNDTDTEMFDDGTHGDEVAGDQVFTTTLVLPRGMRVIYKFTDGSPGEGYTGTEEWPGNARILQVDDVITSDPTGKPDCLVIRRDSFGDESSNKNFVNLHATLGGGALAYDADLGGDVLPAPLGDGLLPVTGLAVDALATHAPLTPAGIPEARENGTCAMCPPPVTVPVDDNVAPGLVDVRFASTDAVRALFTEDLDLGTAAARGNYLLVDEDDVPVPIRGVEVSGALVVLSVDPVDPRRSYRLFVSRVADASLQRNTIANDPDGFPVAGDTVAPTLLDVTASTITDVNPAARPANPRQGEVVVLHFSEVLDRISAENITAYTLEGPGGSLPVHAAFQRGAQVLLVTESLPAGVEHVVRANGVFDVAGNLVGADAEATFAALSLHKVTLNAVPGHAWRSLDGSLRGLPDGEGLYATGTITLAARGVDGSDLRVSGRPDVAGREGYLFSATTEMVAGKPVHALELMLPTGTYAMKLAHGTPRDAIAPPATLETVTKALCTANDATGVLVDPVTMTGSDGLSYVGARLSLGGDEPPAPGILFKRENPDIVINVAEQDVVMPPVIVGTWRDVPFGRGRDYDDGKRELALHVSGAQDTAGPLPVAAEARDSESVLLSFDEALGGVAADLVATVTDEAGIPLSASVAVVGLPRPTQAVLRTGPMALNRGYTVLVTRAVDAGGRVASDSRTVAYTSPGSFTPFTPVVDTEPPAIVSVLPTGPTTLSVRFSERLASSAADPARFAVELRAGGAGPAVTAARITDAGRSVLLTTAPQAALAAYTLVATGIPDAATPANTLASQRVDFQGFGDSEPPTIVAARAISPTRVVVRFNEPVDAASASAAVNWTITGVAVQAALSSHAEAVLLGAFNENWAPVRGDVVVLSTEAMQGGRNYTLTATNVLDRSGNASSATTTFMSPSGTPTVTVELRYLVSATAQVVGVGQGGAAGVPARALSPQRMATEREGLFVLGTALTEDGADPVTDHPVTRTLGGFPAEGSPLDGAEPRLHDDGTNGDFMSGDNVYTVRISGVPLGSVLSWKAFASFSTTYRDANPGDPLAAFADATPGPQVFTDGQEYPGHDNGAWILDDADGDGVVVLDNLFGDEITFKRKTGFRPFAWVTDTWGRQ